MDKFTWQEGDLQPAVEKYDPSQPRHPAGSSQGGQWTSHGSLQLSTAPGKPRVVGKPGPFVERIKKAVDAIPASHAKRIEGIFVEAVDGPLEKIGEAGNTLGLFKWMGAAPLGIHIGTKLRTMTKEAIARIAPEHPEWAFKNIVSPENTVVHELGHALDHSYSWNLGKKLAQTTRIASESFMTPAERRKAAYWLSSPSEMFAELYSLAYSPVRDRQHFGMRTSKAEQAFAVPLRRLREEVPDA